MSTHRARRRRALSHVGGRVETAGEPEAAAKLAQALCVPPARAEGEGPERAHVHGFHAYPARMHPITAARLVRAFTKEGETVLDPFCGSGTVLVEALLAGRRAVGTDLNPLAVRLAAMKTRPHDARERARLAERANAVGVFADARRAAKAGATRRLPREDVESFDPHVLLELDGLRAGIERETDATVRAELGLVLSAILVKVSRKESDASRRRGERRLAAGFTTRLFVKKTEELVRRLAAYARELPAGSGAPPVRTEAAGPARATVTVDDATRLDSVRPGSAHAVITSPPYAATYDYLEHHALRLRWLGLDARALERGEIGARRRYASMDPGEAREAWTKEVADFLRPAARALVRGGRLALLVADTVLRGELVRADEAVARGAARAGLTFVARASQEQRSPHLNASRIEHAVLFAAS